MARSKHTISCIVLSLLLWSCSSGRPVVTSQHIPPALKSTGDLINPSAPKIISLSDKRKQIVQLAVSSLGKPYKWGGNSPSIGFDCSGLVLYTHQKAGIPLPRTAKNQFFNGHPVPLKDLKPADLVFFNHTKASKAYHVGIYVGKGKFIHAPGKGRSVTYGRLDNPYFKEHFIGSKTYL